MMNMSYFSVNYSFYQQLYCYLAKYANLYMRNILLGFYINAYRYLSWNGDNNAILIEI